jgi:hypothetical protein
MTVEEEKAHRFSGKARRSDFLSSSTLATRSPKSEHLKIFPCHHGVQLRFLKGGFSGELWANKSAALKPSLCTKKRAFLLRSCGLCPRSCPSS